MNKKIYLVFEGGAHLSRSSLVLMGVYDDRDKAIADILNEMAGALMFDEVYTEEYVKEFLENNSQTPGMETNYVITAANLNEWEEIL